MQRVILFIFCSFFFTFQCGTKSEKISSTEISGKKLFEMSPEEVDGFLTSLNHMHPNKDERIMIILEKRLGTPLGMGSLGEGQLPDTDPIFRLDSTDCTIHIITTSALIHASNYEESVQNMKYSNYRQVGDEFPISYKNRLHFTYDRIHSSKYYENITSKISEPYQISEEQITLNRNHDGSEFLPLNWTKKITLRYIPRRAISQQIIDKTPRICGVAFVKRKLFNMGIAIAHEGIIVDQSDFYHASSDSKKAVKVDFLAYFQNSKFDGVVLYKIL